MKRILYSIIVLCLVATFIVTLSVSGCKPTAPETAAETTATEVTAAAEETTAAEEIVVAEEQEEYVWICSLSTYTMFLNHDHPALRQLAKELGVKMTFTGPETFDVEAQNAVLEQQIAIKPAGILFLSFGDVHNASINKVIEAGIPLVCVDGDSPNSKRMTFIGTGWKNMGAKQAEIMANELGGKGRVILVSMIPNDNTVLARAGYEEYMAKNYPDIEIVDLLNDEGDSSKAATLVSQAIQTYGDIDGFSGFMATSGPGIATAVREAGMQGKIKVTCIDDSADILQAIDEGIISATLVQKREAFESLGLLTLYNYNHPQTEILKRYKDAGFPMTPEFIYTDTMVLNKDNLDQLQEVYEYVKSVE